MGRTRTSLSRTFFVAARRSPASFAARKAAQALASVDCFNNRRLHGQLTPGPGHITPAAFEADHYAQPVPATPAETQ